MRRIATILLMAMLASFLLPSSLTMAETGSQGMSPTTGLPTDKPYRPMMVEISNSKEARPADGLARADIVYEGIMWGPRHTRYAAIFNDEHPYEVGSVRSTRLFHAELREGWDCPFSFMGGQNATGVSVYDFFKQHNTPRSFLNDGTRGGTGFFREGFRPNPHNAYVKVNMLSGEYWPLNEDGTPYEPRLPGFVFSEKPSRGVDSAVLVDVFYHEDYHATYHYEPETRSYRRWYDGAEQNDLNGDAVTCANVIVVYSWLSYYQNSRSLPIVQTTGSGPMDAFIDGTHIRGHWVRDGMQDQIRLLDAQGETLVMLPGKTFFQYVPMDMEIGFEGTDGVRHTLGAAVEAPVEGL